MDFRAVYDDAKAAATQAIADKFSKGGREQPYNCGFAWVTISSRTAFARWARKANVAGQGYPTGVQFWKPGDWPTAKMLGFTVYGQDMDFHLAGAVAFAAVLNKHGISAVADYRLD